ncbi:MAG: hypothetical protein AB1403_02525 [Candidatus Riflebacteria bacterium]
MVPGATYIGDSEILGAAFFIDTDAPPTILVRFGSQKPEKIAWNDFVELVRCFKFFRQKVSQVLREKTGSLPRMIVNDKISLSLLETRRIKLNWNGHPSVFSHLQMDLVTGVLGGCYVKARPLVDRILEKQRLLAKPGWLETARQYSGFIMFLVLSVINMFFFAGMFFQPLLFKPWIVITLFQLFWLLLFRPGWTYRLLPVFWDYLNEQFLADLSNLRLPRKSIEFFIIIIMGMVYLLCFGSEAANYIFDFYRNVFGIE